MWAASRFFSCGFFLLVFSSVAAGQSSGIPWQQNLEAAKQQARDSGRLVLVHFWADWCPACVRFEKTVFSQPEVAQAIQGRYVAVKLHADHFPSTARAMGVRTLPTDIIITPDGREIARFASADQRRRVATANSFVTEITRLAEVHKPGAAVTIAATAPTQTPVGGNTTVPPATNPYALIGQPSNSGIATPSGNSLPRPVPSSAPVRSGVPVSSSVPVPSGLNGSANAQMPTVTPSSPRAATTPQLPPNNIPTPQAALQNSQPFAPVTSYPNNRTIANSPASSSPMNGAAGGASPIGRYVPQAQQATLQGMTTGQGMTAGSMTKGTNPTQSFVANPQASAATTPTQTPAGYHTPTTPQQSAPAISQRPISQPVAPPLTPPQRQPTLNQSAPRGQAPSQAAPGGNSEFGLDGYCPVTLQHEQRWIVGDRRWGVNHEGRTYLFMGPTQQQQFLSNPNLYSPVLAGADSVLALETGQSVPGSRRHGVVYDSHVFLFSSEATLQRFTQDPDRFAQGVHQAMKLNANQLPPR